MNRNDRSCYACLYRKYNERLSGAGLITSMTLVCTKPGVSMTITNADIGQACVAYKDGLTEFEKFTEAYVQTIESAIQGASDWVENVMIPMVSDVATALEEVTGDK